MKKLQYLFLTFLLSACLAQPVTSLSTEDIPVLITQEENSYAPQPEDASLIKAGIILTSLDLSDTSQPGRTKLTILGSMPSVCNELRVKVNPPNLAYEIAIEIYSIENPNLKCENVFQQVETSILLGEYSPGQYSIWVNSTFVGSIVSY